MSYFKAKMHQIRFRLGLRLPAGGAYSALPNPLAVFEGPTSKGRNGEDVGKGRRGKGEEKRREKEGKGGKGRGQPPISWPRTAPFVVTAIVLFHDK